MIEWIIIITIHTTNTPGVIGNYDVETIDGFKSESTCLKAAKLIGNSIFTQTVNHRSAEGMDLNSRYGDVIVFTDCQKITK
jgi:hypothetical protein